MGHYHPTLTQPPTHKSTQHGKAKIWVTNTGLKDAPAEENASKLPHFSTELYSNREEGTPPGAGGGIAGRPPPAPRPPPPPCGAGKGSGSGGGRRRWPRPWTGPTAGEGRGEATEGVPHDPTMGVGSEATDGIKTEEVTRLNDFKTGYLIDRNERWKTKATQHGKEMGRARSRRRRVAGDPIRILGDR